MDEAAARFFGWSAADAAAVPDGHYLAVVRAFRAGWRDGSRLSLAIRAGERAVGAVELRPEGTAVHVSFVVTPAWRGRNVAARALTAFLDWASPTLAVLTCHVENVASQQVAERCGFNLVDRTGDELRYERRA